VNNSNLSYLAFFSATSRSFDQGSTGEPLFHALISGKLSNSGFRNLA